MFIMRLRVWSFFLIKVLYLLFFKKLLNEIYKLFFLLNVYLYDEMVCIELILKWYINWLKILSDCVKY